MTTSPRLTAYAKTQMRRRGITVAMLNHLLTHGDVDQAPDGGKLVSLPDPAPSWRTSRATRTLYAIIDGEGEIILVEYRVRRDNLPHTPTTRPLLPPEYLTPNYPARECVALESREGHFSGATPGAPRPHSPLAGRLADILRARGNHSAAHL